jgi:hypothetical protein
MNAAVIHCVVQKKCKKRAIGSAANRGKTALKKAQ